VAPRSASEGTSHPGRLLSTRILICSVFVGVLAGSSRIASAHEPIRGFGPNTLWKGGVSIGLGYELTTSSHVLDADHEVKDPTHARERMSAIKLELMYGLTANLLLRAEAAVAYDETLGTQSRYDTRFDDFELAMKWRFFKDNEIGTALSAALEGSCRVTGDGSTRTTLGFALSRDTLWLFLWGDIRLAIDDGMNVRPSVAGVVDLDFAVGFHAWRVEYGQPDIVIILESNAEYESPRRDRRGNSLGGFVEAISPGFLFFVDAWEVKGSLQVPVYERVHGTHLGHGLAGILQVEFHY